MLKVQEFLKDGHTFEDLAQFGILVKKHPVHDIYILDYDQLESKPGRDISDECRSLVLDGNFDVVSGCMKRFFNYGQLPEYEKDFNWNSFVGWEKRDGSMLSITLYKGELLIRTRFSWADGQVGFSGKTWTDLVHEALETEDQQKMLLSLDRDTLVFELETPYNQVVLYHEKPQLVLLTAIRNEDGGEWIQPSVDALARLAGFRRPDKYEFKNLEEVQTLLDKWNAEGRKDEGFVLYDNERRLKLKNDRYKYYHSIVTGIQSIRQVFDIVWDDKVNVDELIIEYPHLAPTLAEVEQKLHKAWDKLWDIWWETSDIKERKKFAFAITREDSEYYTPFNSILFKFRDKEYTTDTELKRVWREHKDLIFKVLFKEK